MIPRHKVAIHCQWSTGAYASLIGIWIAAPSERESENPLGRSAIGRRWAVMGPGDFGVPSGDLGGVMGEGRVEMKLRISADLECQVPIASR